MASDTNWWDSIVDFGSDLYDYGAKAYDTVSDYGADAYDTVVDYGANAYDNVVDYGNAAYDTVANYDFPSFSSSAGDNPGATYGSNGRSRSIGAGAGTDVGSGLNVTEGAGSGTGLSLNSSTGGLSFNTSNNAPTTAGVTGGLGVTPPRSDGQSSNPSLLAGGNSNVNANYALGEGGTFNAPPPPQSGFRGAVNQAENGIRGAQEFARENYNVARLGLDLAGMGLGYKNRQDANKLAQEQMQMQRAAQQKNAAVADRANAQSAQSFNEARSMYNPQEMAIRSMADAKMANMRAQEAARTQMQKSGRSKGTIDAEMRRAQLAGTTGANTAYLRGLDTGRAAQQSALGSAANLARDYNTGADYSAADRVAKAGQSNSDQLTAMLNNYLGNPVYQQNAAAQRRAQQDAYYYQ